MNIKLFFIFFRQTSVERRVCLEDYESLVRDEILTGAAFNFYLKHLTTMVLTNEDQSRTHVFGSNLYRCLRTRDNAGRLCFAAKKLSMLRKLTGNVKVFDKDFIFVPINDNNSQWSVAVICFPYLAVRRGNVQTKNEVTKKYVVILKLHFIIFLIDSGYNFNISFQSLHFDFGSTVHKAKYGRQSETFGIAERLFGL